MSNILDSIMSKSIQVMIDETSNAKKLTKFTKKHENKIHFIKTCKNTPTSIGGEMNCNKW